MVINTERNENFVEDLTKPAEVRSCENSLVYKLTKFQVVESTVAGKKENLSEELTNLISLNEQRDSCAVVHDDDHYKHKLLNPQLHHLRKLFQENTTLSPRDPQHSSSELRVSAPRWEG